MFQSRTGWVAVLLTVIGALTATDVMPLLSAFLTETVGPQAAHAAGALLGVLGAVVAKLSEPKPPASGE